MASIRITLQMLPRDPSGAPFNATAAALSTSTSASSTSASDALARPWLNATVANLDPGPLANSSLAQPVAAGSATWRGVVPRGWPGDYHLLFTAEVLSEDTGVPPVAPLRVRARLLRCLVGDTLELDTAQQLDAPSWTACASCRWVGGCLPWTA